MSGFASVWGLPGWLDDAREFVGGVRFAAPQALWLFALLPVFGLLDVWAARRRRQALAALGRPASLAAQFTRPRSGWGSALGLWVAWALLILGIAGPRWGVSDETAVAVGRDVVIVLDLSRSMWADDMVLPAGGWRVPDTREAEADRDQARRSGDPERIRSAEERLRRAEAERHSPTRWRAARDAALDLLDGIARRGGHRVGVVIFAARPWLLCPLTTDYDHVREVLGDLDGEYPPAEIRPAPGTSVPSGTRIGAALAAAVAAHDCRFPGYQDIVLLSDGDDPGDDREWLRGADAARAAGIPVHTVGFGNPDTPAVLHLDDQIVRTRLQEAPLEQIAAETRGQYLPARTRLPALGEYFRTHIEPLPARVVSDETLPLPRERYGWFLLPALVLLALAWWRGR